MNTFKVAKIPTMLCYAQMPRYFSDGKFAEVSDPTVGVDFFSRLVTLRGGARVKLQLWDTAGQERFRSITKSYYRNRSQPLPPYGRSH